MVVDAPIMKL